jgi:hypothetical protein
VCTLRKRLDTNAGTGSRPPPPSPVPPSPDDGASPCRLGLSSATVAPTTSLLFTSAGHLVVVLVVVDGGGRGLPFLDVDPGLLHRETAVVLRRISVADGEAAVVTAPRRRWRPCPRPKPLRRPPAARRGAGGGGRRGGGGCGLPRGGRRSRRRRRGVRAGEQDPRHPGLLGGPRTGLRRTPFLPHLAPRICSECAPLFFSHTPARSCCFVTAGGRAGGLAAEPGGHGRHLQRAPGPTIPPPPPPTSLLRGLLRNMITQVPDLNGSFHLFAQETDIGRHVNGLRKHPSAEVRRLVKQLIR